MNPVARYIEQVGRIKMFVDYFAPANDKITCSIEVYSTNKYGESICIHWHSTYFDKLQRKQENFYMCSILGDKSAAQLDDKEKWKLNQWQNVSSWGHYKDSFGYNGGYVMDIGSMSEDDFYSLESSLSRYIDNDSRTKLRDYATQAHDEQKAKRDEMMDYLKTNADVLCHTDEALEKMAELVSYQKGKTLAKALGGAAKNLEGNEELAEIQVMLNLIKAYTPKMAECVTAFRHIAETLSPWQKDELITSAWRVKHLLHN